MKSKTGQASISKGPRGSLLVGVGLSILLGVFGITMLFYYHPFTSRSLIKARRQTPEYIEEARRQQSLIGTDHHGYQPSIRADPHGYQSAQYTTQSSNANPNDNLDAIINEPAHQDSQREEACVIPQIPLEPEWEMYFQKLGSSHINVSCPAFPKLATVIYARYAISDTHKNKPCTCEVCFTAEPA
jgi:hypothetical protein